MPRLDTKCGLFYQTHVVSPFFEDQFIKASIVFTTWIEEISWLVGKQKEIDRGPSQVHKNLSLPVAPQLSLDLTCSCCYVRNRNIKREILLKISLNAEVTEIILAGANKMRSLVCVLLCIALSQAQFYTTSTSTVTPTGYFTPVYTSNPPAYWQFDVEGLTEGFPSEAVCDGYLSRGRATCSTFQVVIYSPFSQNTTFPELVNVTVSRSDIVQVTLGQNYTTVNPTVFMFSSSVPYYTNINGRVNVGYLVIDYEEAGVNVTTSGYPYLIYLSSPAVTFPLSVNSGLLGSTTTYQGITYPVRPYLCASQNETAVLLREGTSQTSSYAPSYCSTVKGYGQVSYTLISAQTQPTLTVSTSGNYTATCQIYGNTSDHFALVKLNTKLEGGFINGTQVQRQSDRGFDTVFNCGSNNNISLSVQIDGPFQTINVTRDQPSLPYSNPDFYHINLPAGIISQNYGNPLPLGSPTSCSSAFSIDYFGYIPNIQFGLCYTVTANSSFTVPAWNNAFVIQPPKGYCIRGDGIPSNSSNNVYFSFSTQSTLYYEDTNTSLFTLTCAFDVMSIEFDQPTPMNINFTLVKMNGQGVYGKNYTVNGLTVLQYPPLSADVGVVSVHLNGSVTSLYSQIGLGFESRKRTAQYYPTAPNTLQSNTSSSVQFIVAVVGQGQVTTNLGTAAGVNVGYDANYSLYPTTSSSSTQSTGSTSTPLNGGTTATSPVSSAAVSLRGATLSVMALMMLAFL
ncbi:hypothetical protein PROFUN_14760 [Planoprotostelium fungivorum]|uniref:Uncharacterized protein n=1 Tax=Planoprotostelium fungivorum TaxID=1890364 RepID=A0A2P6MYP2_9EUKA|nr:hypothetical protein PROFUN_14760 [Planoprotostelium fungivorum]